MPINPFETSNPFAVTAPGVPSAQTAEAPSPAAVTQAGSQGYSATLAPQAQGYEAATATNERAAPTLRTVQDNELVQRQLAQIIGNDSPLIQRARARAAEQMNARGLVNSSMALGAADAAMYDVALPIAQADAATFGGVARDNQAVSNSMAQFNAGESNQTSRANAGLINQARQFSAGEQNQTSRFNAGQANDASRFGADAANQASRFNADASNRAALQANEQTFRASTFNAEQANANARTQADMQFRAALANSDAQTRAALSVLDNEFAAQRQASGAASEVWRQYQSSATAIMTSDLPAESKQRMVQQLAQMTRQSMVATRALDQAGIDAILTMTDLAVPVSNMGPSGSAPAGSGGTPGGSSGGVVSDSGNSGGPINWYTDPYQGAVSGVA